MKLVKHHRPEEALADVIKTGVRGARDVQRATGTEKARTVERVEEVAEDAGAAKSVADQAAEDVLAQAQAIADVEAKANAAVVAISYEYALGTQTVPPTSGWSIEPPTWVEGSWLWRRDTEVKGDGSTSTGEPYLATGPAGSPGQDGTDGTPGRDGVDGQDGAPGADGRGIVSAATTYQASASGTSAPTGTWNTAIPSVPAGQYLWTRTITTYTDGGTSTAYSVGRSGANGANGTPGQPGADGQTSYLHVAYANNSTGTSGFSTTDPSGRSYMGTYTDFVEADSTDPTKYAWSLIKGADGANGGTGPAGKGIASSVVTYQAGSSATTAPTGAWSGTVPAVPAGQFLWTRTIITFTDAATTTTYSVARQGVNGADGAPGADGRSITSVDVLYYLSTSSTTQTGGSWQTTPPAWVDGRFMWSKTVTTYSTGSPSETAPVNITGAKGATGSAGAPGSDGRGISSTTITYQGSASGTTAPTGTWSTSIPAVAAGSYLWTRTVIAYTDASTSTAYAVARMGANGAAGTPGAPGADGANGADGRGVTSIVEEYYLSTSSTTQTGGSWSVTVPAWVDGRFYWTRSKITYTDASVVTTTPVMVSGGKGATGNTGATGTGVTSITRFYFLSASQPPVPTASPPPAPWLTTEPAYSAGSSANLYEVTRTILSTGAWSYGPVSLSAAFTAAKQAYQEAAGSRLVAEGLYAVIPAAAEPTTRANGTPLAAGDQWWVVGTGEHAGRFVGVRVYDGQAWDERQIVANSILVPGSVGSVLIEDGAVIAEKIAAGAIDAKTINAPQIFGGYIEAPTIASSDKLGSGANVLADPLFQSTPDTSWVASGHRGDAAKAHTTTLTWSKSYPWLWNDTSTVDRWHQGNGVIRMSLTPDARRTGSVLFANYGWVPANRTLNNWYAFPTGPSKSFWTAKSDPSWITTPFTPLAGTTRTTYLTNSGTFAVTVGTRWNARLEFTPVQSNQVDLAKLYVEVINAATSAVLWSREVLEIEMRAGQVNDWWDATITGNVKFRIKAVYTAAGGTGKSEKDIGSTSSVHQGGTLSDTWTASASDRTVYYLSSPNTMEINRRATFRIVMSAAVFASVEPTRGWRLTEEGGLELFSAVGARTGKLDGEDNYLNGRFATKETGLRAEMKDAAFNLTNLAGGVIGQFYSDGTDAFLTATRLRIGTYEVPAEVAMNNSAVVATSGHTFNTGSWLRRRSDGYVYGTLQIDRPTGTFPNGGTLITLPSLFRPLRTEEFSGWASIGGAASINLAQITNTGIVRVWEGATGSMTGRQKMVIEVSYWT